LEEYILPERLKGLALGYGVVFPQADFDVQSVEWAPEVVLDRRGMASPEATGRWLRHLCDHWRERTHVHSDAAETLVREVRDLLRPEFDRVPPLAARAADAVNMMERLTEEQYRQLDFIEDSPRLLCTGGAGTGKTFLAAEMARRAATRGDRVLFTCWSPHLAAFVRSRVPVEVEVRTFDEIATAPWPDERRPDYLVVDEAQDLMAMSDLAVLDRCVTGGLEGGRWSIFLDPNLQSAVRSRIEPDALELLRTYGGVPGHLRWNCRNTQPVVLQTRMLTAADLGNPSAGAGPAVEFVFYRDRSECAAFLERHLAELTAGDIGLGDITLLSPLPFEESSVALVKPRWLRSLVRLTAEKATLLPIPAMTFAQVVEFKGLENRFICVVDLDALDATDHDLAIVYVAMSRARVGLWMAFNRALEADVRDVSARNLKAAIRQDVAAR
jgi:hypothetical protein